MYEGKRMAESLQSEWTSKYLNICKADFFLKVLNPPCFFQFLLPYGHLLSHLHWCITVRFCASLPPSAHRWNSVKTVARKAYPIVRSCARNQGPIGLHMVHLSVHVIHISNCFAKCQLPMKYVKINP